MFDDIRFKKDLFNFCKLKQIDYYSLTYTEQLAVIRSMLVAIANRGVYKMPKLNNNRYFKKRKLTTPTKN